jgi:preprotein translocase subunit SecD
VRALELASNALRLENDNIAVYLEEDLAKNFTLVPRDNKTRAIVEAGSPLIAKLREAGFAVVEKTNEDMTPKYSVSSESELSDAVVNWPSVGLLSAPRLVPSVTEGIPNFSYVINGPAEGASLTDRAADAAKKERELESLLKGGALPVQISLGSKTVIPAQSS